jgi:hypothetical protein
MKLSFNIVYEQNTCSKQLQSLYCSIIELTVYDFIFSYFFTAPMIIVKINLTGRILNNYFVFLRSILIFSIINIKK